MSERNVSSAAGHEAVDLQVLELWINTGCNSRCLTCEIWRERPGTVITSAEIASWLPEWVRLGLDRVELCGEPTLHPELEEVCRLLVGRGVKIHFLSNGLRLLSAHDLIRRWGTGLTVSLDGPPQVHDQVRNVPRAFERLARGVARLRDRDPGFPVYGRCAVHRLNYRAMRATVETARDLGLSWISFLALDTTTGAFGRDRLEPGTWAGIDGLALGQEDLPGLLGELDALERLHAADFESGFIRESPAKLRSVLWEYYAGVGTPGQSRPVACNTPWNSVVLEPDGAVRPCFFLPAYGNLREAGSLSSLLDSPAARGMRRELDVQNHPVCQRCICPREFAPRPAPVT